MSGHTSEKKGSNIICRVSNITPEMVCRYVKRLPKQIMTEPRFRNIMGKSWFQNEHQAPEQWGLYYIDGVNYYPRFNRDISLQEAESYIYHWMRNLIVINPYTRFKTTNDNKLVESIVHQLEQFPNQHDLKTIIRKIIGSNEPFVVNEIIANALNNYSEVLKVDIVNKDEERFSVSLLPDYKKILNKRYDMTKKEYFELFENKPKNTENITTAFRPYITAIKSKPFLLLAGISGTGKSRIVRELARACWDEGTEEYEAQKPRNFEMVQVKPNWHDSSELIGYVSRVSGEPVFVAGDFLKFIAKAWEEPLVPYFLCLDEMNLAPVEQYFAEYLSVIESRKADRKGNITTDPILKKNKEDWYRVLTSELTDDEDVRNQFLEDGICIPQNLIVIGTVNMDETTFSFSRKVLDRAMTIEMNEVNLTGGLDSRHEKIGKLGTAELIGTAVEGVDIYSSYKEVCDTAIEYLQSINEKLEGTPFKIAYRTRNEVLLYVVNNLPYNKIEGDEENVYTEEYIIARALDEITNMKILSRIEGDETKVSKSFLDDLKGAIKEGLEKVFNEIFDEDDDDVYTSVSLAKLDEMKKRLDSGYTSFWS